LLVDDHDFFRRALAKVLTPQSGFQVVGEAGDGLEAIVKARALQPDLILMDMSMPGCDGLEATRRIRQELPGVVIIILTSCPEDSRVVQALDSGARGCLSKSVDLDQMTRILHRLVATEPELRGTGEGHSL